MMWLKNCLISPRTEIRFGFSRTLGLLLALWLALEPGTARAQVGNLMLWGDTDSGQLAEPAPPEVFTKVANYYATVVGLRQDGSIKAWGYEENIIDNVPTGSGYTDVTVNAEAGFAINQSGQIVGWGDDYSVGLLSGIPPGSGYVSVVGAYQAAFALNQAGEILAWGSDEYLLISQRPTGGGFTKVVDNGDATALALAADGSIRAWGYDEDVVDNVPAGTGYRDIAGAYYGAVAIKEDGTLVAWGGDPFMTDVPAGNDFVAVAGAEDVGLALRANGTVVAWGGSEYNLVAGVPVTGGISSIYSMYYSFAALSGGGKKVSSEAKCQKALALAKGKYQLCMQKEQGKLYGGGDYSKFVEKSGKCIDKYVETWPKLVAKYAGKGTSCEGDRYLENGDGTFYDRLTQLTWEQKDDSDGIHDKDNVYTWTQGDRADFKENGSAFTDFLAELNKDEEGPEPVGLTDSRGWRIPTVNELATLVEPGYPNCASSPCTTVPGETAEAFYGSSSTYPTLPNVVWGLNFSDGGAGSINKYDSFAVRAVRGGS